MTWRERRKLSYLINEFDDYRLPYKELELSDEELVAMIVQFFYEGSELVYPAKSYFVAIVYAKLLERYFSVPFYEALDTDDLLIEDKFFKPYQQAEQIYNNVLSKIPKDFLTLSTCGKTISYFKQEFLIGKDTED